MNGFFLFWKAFYFGMKRFGESVVNIVNFILLIPAYFIGIGLTAMVAKLFGKHFLNLSKGSKKTKTYWIKKESDEIKEEDFYRQF